MFWAASALAVVAVLEAMATQGTMAALEAVAVGVELCQFWGPRQCWWLW